MNRTTRCTLLTIIALALASVAQARTLVVNPALAGASDTNPGSATQPLRTISRAAELVQPGDVVRIHSGIYREKVTVKQSGTKERPIRFEAAADSNVVVTGADPLTGWRKEPGEDNIFSTAWPYRIVPPNPHLPGGVEQVLINHQLLIKASSLKEVTGGAFFVDESGKRVFVRADCNPDETQAERPVEGSARPVIWDVIGAYVQTCGLRFRYAANRAQQAMAQFRGAHAVVEDCVFEWSNSTGAQFRAEDITVLRCTFQDNGQQGFTANGAHRLRFDRCTVQRNNVKNYPRGWEAGGNKLCFTRGAILENSRFLKNHGSGVWFDISNVDCTVRNCLIADNEDAGIFYEISYGLHAHDNVIVGNGLANTKGAWGANGGICVSSSPGCVIERNLIIGNQQGFCFREQNRTTWPIADVDRGTVGRSSSAEVPIWNHDEVIRNNLIVNNLTAQVHGWFDIATERHWPRAMQTSEAGTGKAKADLAAGYQRREDLVPPGLTLEDLKLTFRGNIYVFLPNEPFFIWGANWKRKRVFQDIPSLTKSLGFEDQHSRILPPVAVDMTLRDFRLPKDHPAIAAGVYPRGKVPDCVLGVR
jgi:hypothetical protein